MLVVQVNSKVLMLGYTYILQVLEANSMKGGVELLDIRPDQLTSSDLEGEQVLEEWTMLSLG